MFTRGRCCLKLLGLKEPGVWAALSFRHQHSAATAILYNYSTAKTTFWGANHSSSIQSTQLVVGDVEVRFQATTQARFQATTHCYFDPWASAVHLFNHVVDLCMRYIVNELGAGVAKLYFFSSSIGALLL
ncbi:predicted protein [Lichtheimia corymbifera JMRC:FSU:9682]|uniref:Uncharacterized protein n=1 Tax=Lichtheimia corymbifera JMRC:FSU:9682 TaxID=1263082 RepID=A0A068RJT1_9FUNG|nr:predicted protein [Lichtheimia corymbifera JMRC:FSU:9682]